jgi:transcriptional regulator with XRE-family HTH domain
MSNVHSSEYQRFLKRLRLARSEAKLTQAEIAKGLKKPQSFVSKAESGERRLDFAEVQRFARLYKKRLEYFEL